MRARKKALVITVCAAVVLFVVAYFSWVAMRRTAVYACVASIHKALDSHELSGDVITGTGTDWNVLTVGESDRLLLRAYKTGSLDCMWRSSDGIPVDPWGSHFQVAARRTASNKNPELLIWSNGQDKAPGTSDDIVSPHGKKIPGVLSR